MVGLSQAWKTVQGMIDGFIASLPLMGLAILIFALFYWAARWIRSLIRHFAETAGVSPSASRILGRLSRWLVIFAGLLIALSVAIPSFTTGQLIQLLGLGSVAIGFAFRDILENLLAGLLLLLTEPFRVGDQIVVNSFEGTVEDIETRATTIRTYDSRRIVIPNADLFTESVTVNTAFPVRRSEYDVGIGYGDDIGQAMRLILGTMESVDGVLKEPAPDVLVSELGDFSVNIRARWWTDSRRASVLAVRSRVIAAIKSNLLESGIDLPFPTQQILFHDQTEETDGDRSRQREGWPAAEGWVPQAGGIAASLGRLAETLGQQERS